MESHDAALKFETGLPDARAFHELFETTGWKKEYGATPDDAPGMQLPEDT